MACLNLIAAFLEGTTTKAETRKLMTAVGASATLFASVAAAAAVTSCASYILKKAKETDSKNIKEPKMETNKL